jgi:hypothetical protein
MIKLTTENTAKAVQRSKELKPRVLYVADRIFDVESSRNNRKYRVHLFLIRGEKFAECTCQASEKGFVCYHVTSAVSVNFYRQNVKAERNTFSDLPTVEQMNNAPIIRQFSQQSERRGSTRI